MVECPRWTFQWGSWDIGSVFWIMPPQCWGFSPRGGAKPLARKSTQAQLLLVLCSRATEQTSSREPGHAWSCNLRCCHCGDSSGACGDSSAPSALGALRDTKHMWDHLKDFGCSLVFFGSWICHHRSKEHGLLFWVL